MKKNNFLNYLLCAVLIVLGVASRLVIHIPNFTPIFSIALLAGLYVKNRFIVIIPISIMLISDLYIGSHALVPWIYFSIAIICLIGYLAKNNTFNVLFYSMLSAVLFFIISNFGVWFSGGYTYTIEGLITCYIAAIPFFKNTLISTVLFSSFIHIVYNFLNLMIQRQQSGKIFEKK